MSHSLRDQLLKAGLVNEKQVKQAKQAQRKQARRQRKQPADSGESSDERRRVLAEQAERDRRLNRERQQASERKALEAQIRQLIENGRVPLDDGEIPYHFQDQRKVKTLYVTEPVRRQLVEGKLAIVVFEGHYSVVPVPVAEKIRDRDERCVVLCGPPAPPADEAAEGYADYPVPDDLMW